MSDLQDGMLRYYQEQVRASDVTVEKRLDCEPFDYRDHLVSIVTVPGVGTVMVPEEIVKYFKKIVMK